MAGIGMGLTFAPSATAVLDGLPEEEFAVASSANSTIREFGVALGVALLIAVFLGNGGTITPSGYDGAVGPALLTGAASVAIAAVAALCTDPREGPQPGLTRPNARHAGRRSVAPRDGPASCPRVCPRLGSEGLASILRGPDAAVAMARPDHSQRVRHGLTGLSACGR